MLQRILIGILVSCCTAGCCLLVMAVTAIFVDVNAVAWLSWISLFSFIAGLGVFCHVWADDIASEKRKSNPFGYTRRPL